MDFTRKINLLNSNFHNKSNTKTQEKPTCMKMDTLCENYWKIFQEKKFQPEMVVSKKGRRMFPHIHFKIDNVEPSGVFNVFLEFITDNDILSFDADTDEWFSTKKDSCLYNSASRRNAFKHTQAETGTGFPATSSSGGLDSSAPQKGNLKSPTNSISSNNSTSFIVQHKSNPISGWTMSKYGVNFIDLKLSNSDSFKTNDKDSNEMDKNGSCSNLFKNLNSSYAHLKTLRKYTMRVHLIRVTTMDIYIPGMLTKYNAEATELNMLGKLPDFPKYQKDIHSIETFTLDREIYRFIPVTSYRNAAMTDIKILKNPKARGPSATRRKINYSSIVHDNKKRSRDETGNDTDNNSSTLSPTSKKLKEGETNENSFNSSMSSGVYSMNESSDDTDPKNASSDFNAASASQNFEYDSFGFIVDPKFEKIGKHTFSYGIPKDIVENDGALSMSIKEPLANKKSKESGNSSNSQNRYPNSITHGLSIGESFLEQISSPHNNLGLKSAFGNHANSDDDLSLDSTTNPAMGLNFNSNFEKKNSDIFGDNLNHLMALGKNNDKSSSYAFGLRDLSNKSMDTVSNNPLTNNAQNSSRNTPTHTINVGNSDCVNNYFSSIPSVPALKNTAIPTPPMTSMMTTLPTTVSSFAPNLNSLGNFGGGMVDNFGLGNYGLGNYNNGNGNNGENLDFNSFNN